jgi:hypothetical protein
MPKIKKAVRRLSIIANALVSKPLSKIELQEMLFEKIQEHVCCSTIEKDLFLLRMDFDAPIVYQKRNNTYHIKETYDFNQSLLNWLNV